MEKICGKIRAAIDKYNMIEDGDCIAVGVSGGKDSLVLLYCLHNIMQYYPKHFTIKAITADPCINGKNTDFSEIEKLCNELNIPYIIKRTDLFNIIFNERKEKNPCSLCARMRRGILHKLSKEHNCNKIALGHHGDDAVQTFLMNLFDSGKIGCFSPKSYLSRSDLYLLRPMIFCSEKEIERIANRVNLPVVKSECPADGFTERQSMADLILQLEGKYPDLKPKIIGAMERNKTDGWK